MAHYESFFVHPEDVQGNFLIIRGDEFKHLVKVLRKRVGDVLIAVDGHGNSYEFGIISIDRDFVRGEIQKIWRRRNEPLTHIILVQAMIKNPRFDWLLEKATELGVSTFLPISSEFTIVEPDKNRLRRWNRIVMAAIKQSGRSVLPGISEPQPFEEVLQQLKAVPVKILPEMEGKSSIRSVLQAYLKMKRLPPREVAILIGPEGGFSPAEIQRAKNAGFETVSLGSRRLRSETAAIAASCQVLTLLDEL
ncbi:MAG: 16S rRNA (uracil(1498)-N(3))-methyltransferase [Calditrichaeota bacterium]|nr:16S rRNA (uracil(1498)-N(3))-methyltransferase [Calditrichota bacterium]